MESDYVTASLFINARLYENEHFIDDCYILNRAVQMNNIFLVEYLCLIKELVEYMETTDQNGKNPMQLAVDVKNSDMILTLVAKGAKLSLQSIRVIMQQKIW